MKEECVGEEDVLCALCFHYVMGMREMGGARFAGCDGKKSDESEAKEWG